MCSYEYPHSILTSTKTPQSYLICHTVKIKSYDYFMYWSYLLIIFRAFENAKLKFFRHLSEKWHVVENIFPLQKRFRLMGRSIRYHIRKTCPCNEYPLIPHFYISPIRMRKKYTRVNILRCVFILRCANQPESKFKLRSHGFYRQEYFCR